MTEGRLCQVHLLDGRKLELLVQPKLLSRELLDLVASHFNLKEKEYFGLSYIDDTGQNNWLHLDRKALDHDFSKTSGPLELKFLVRFYIEKITFLKDNTTVELFFLNAKSLVSNETIEVESENVFKLAAFALQVRKSLSAEIARSDLKQLPVLPTRVLREHPSLNYCEDKVIEHYKKLKGLTRGQAILPLMSVCVCVCVCGVCAFMQDKQGIPWWLGVSYKGIGQYDLQDKLKPRKLYQWKQLENLYFREKKFAVEVNDPHRRTVTKQTFGQTGLVIHTWYASHSLIKTIWVMAISQHQFYLDRKQSKSTMTTTRSSGDIAMDLTEICAPRISKLSSIESRDQLIMASNGSLISAGSADSEVSEEQKKEKVAELKKKEKDLKHTLTQKLEELKQICMREAELTGRLPKEYPLATGEKAPHVRRRVGTAFKLDDLFPYDEDPHLRNLESRFALQQKIVEAAIKLSNEDDLCKTVKKKRRNNCLDAMRKLEEIEREINAYRIKKGRKPTQRASLILADYITAKSRILSTTVTVMPYQATAARLNRLPDSHVMPAACPPPPSLPATPTAALSSGRAIIHQCISLFLSHQQLMGPVTHQSCCSHQHFTINLSEDAPQHFRQRSGSLESQSQLLTETEPPVPTFAFSPARRSNSTEVLDDGSSYTSQSSVEYSIPGNHTHRRRARGRHRKDMYANTGSMPNLAQPDTRCYAYQPQARPTTTAYYVTGYPSYAEPEPYSNGVYMYGNEMEGHYNVNPSYNPTPTAYHGHDMHSHYGNDEIDSMSQNPYATLRPPRNRQVPRSNEQVGKNIQKALVAEHLRGWYQRNAAHKQASLRLVLLSSLTVHWPLLSYRYGSSQLFKGSRHSPDGQRRCAFFPTSSSSSASSSISSLPSSTFTSSYSPGCRVRQVASSPAQPQSSRGHRLSKVSFAKGSS
uniref:FERM domain containing 4B n=1 Tax=Sander lucioperca TaxID=283035 RepID=A0A8C9YCQ1_SANLU